MEWRKQGKENRKSKSASWRAQVNTYSNIVLIYESPYFPSVSEVSIPGWILNLLILHYTAEYFLVATGLHTGLEETEKPHAFSAANQNPLGNVSSLRLSLRPHSVDMRE